MVLDSSAAMAGSDIVARPRIRLVTALGDLLLELASDKAPLAATAFQREVEAGTFDGGSFNRLVRHDNDCGSPPIAVIQASCASGNVIEANVPLEPTDVSGLRHLDGTLSLPRGDSELGSAASFFICMGDQPALDSGGGRTNDNRGFSAFGQLIDGMTVAQEIHNGATLAEAPVEYLMGQIAAAPVEIYHAAVEPSSASACLARLADDYWRYRIREFPLEASDAGVAGHDHRLEGVREEDYARRARLAAAMLSRADAICEAELSLDEIATLGLLRGQLGSTVEAFALAEQCRSRFFPFGFADLPAQLAQSTALETVAARDAFARRLEAMPMFFRDSLFLLRAGLNNGYYLPRILVSRLLASLDGHLGADGLASIVDRRLAEPIPGSAPEIIARQRQRMDAIVQQAVLPALQDVRDAIAELDEKQLTDKIGLCDQPDGLAYYRYKARQQTSLDIDVLEIHEIGKTEVTRIHAEIDAVLLDMGRPGQRREVAAELDATVAPDGEALLIKVRAFAKKIDGLMPRLFGRLPGITYAVEQLEVGV